MSIKLVIFDGDGTLWKSNPNDWISKVKSDFKLIDKNKVIRLKDGAQYEFMNNAIDVLESLKDMNILIGLVSDNNKKDVMKVIKLFEIDNYFNSYCVEIKLFNGPCPKDKLIKNIIKRLNEKQIYIKPEEILFIDNEDYEIVKEKIGVNFVRMNKDIKNIKEILNILK